MCFGKGGDGEGADGNRFAGIELHDELRFDGKPELLPGAFADIDGQLIAFRQHLQSPDMVVVFVGDEEKTL